jgi:hypothetical protein
MTAEFMATGRPDPTRAAREITDQRVAATAARACANAILASASELIETVLVGRGIGLLEPVAARFHSDRHGSCGIELTVRLEDPTRASLAKSAITERLGGESRCDSLIIS